MIVYIDREYKCHVTNPDGIFRKVETAFFDCKCDSYIEGYRFVPTGESWTRFDGLVFNGEMIAPFKSWLELDAEQRNYEREQLEAVKRENDELLSDLAAVVDAVYESDVERIES